MEALGGQAPKGPQRAALVGAEEAVGVVLDHGYAVPAGDLEDGVHLAGHAGIVHGHHGPGAGRDERLELRLVQVEGVGTDVDEDRAGTAEHERVHRGHEGERRHNDLVAWPDVQEQRGEFEGVRAGRREQDLRHAQRLFEERVAAARIGPVPGDVALLEGVGHVAHLGADEARLVEGDPVRAHRPTHR